MNPVVFESILGMEHMYVMYIHSHLLKYNIRPHQKKRFRIFISESLLNIRYFAHLNLYLYALNNGQKTKKYRLVILFSGLK